MKKLAMLAVACLAAAWLRTVPVSADQGFLGERDYQIFCASCHGAMAKGDGPIAKSLPKHPPDLTRLTARNNAVFPDDTVFNTIDGRTGSAHNSQDMPAWGDVFAKSRESAGAEQAKARITALVAYLKTIQEKQ